MYQDPVEDTPGNQDIRQTKDMNMTSISTTLGVIMKSNR